MEIKPLMDEKEEKRQSHLHLKTYNVYTDGAYSKDYNLGGWSYVIVHNKEVLFTETKLVEGGTNNTAELTGMIEGMKAYIKYIKPQIDYRVNLICDSTYVISGIKRGWINKWKANNWRRYGTPHEVKNRALWEEIDRLNDIIPNTNWVWVRGHNGNHFNEMVDKNIQEAIKKATKNMKKVNKFNEKGDI